VLTSKFSSASLDFGVTINVLTVAHYQSSLAVIVGNHKFQARESWAGGDERDRAIGIGLGGEVDAPDAVAAAHRPLCGHQNCRESTVS
jgi:hypothetical protein